MRKSIWLALWVFLFLLVSVGCSDAQRPPSSPKTVAPAPASSGVVSPSKEVGQLSADASLGSKELAALAILGVLTLVLVLVFLHQRRVMLLDSPHLVTPENFRAWTGYVERRIDRGHEVVAGMHEGTARTHDRLFAQFEELQKTFLTLQGALDIRDQQLRRAESGWELQVFKRFLTRFARIDAMLNEEDAPDSVALLNDTRTMLDDALAECGVQKFNPRLGADYRSEDGVGDHPQLVRTPDEALHYTIKSVISPAYVADMPNGQRFVVVPARVEIYAPLENAS